MFEVYQADDGWRWRLICSNGRTLYGSAYAYRTQAKATTIVKKIRNTFFIVASEVDHRQGACI